MGLRLSSVGVGYIGGVIIAFVGIGIYTAYESIDHALNYQQAAARVTAVEALCAYDIDHPDYTGTVRWESCGTLADTPWDEMKRLNMLRMANVHFTFVSPADGRQHEGLFEVRGQMKIDNALRLFPGKAGAIWASTDDPADYHYDAWPFGSPRTT